MLVVSCDSHTTDHTHHTGTSKAALDMLTKMMGMELGQHKVTTHYTTNTHTLLLGR